MNQDPEGSVRALLRAVDHQPELLNTHLVIAAGRRRVRRRRLAPAAAIAAAALLGTGVTVRELRGREDAAQTVALSPGGWQRLDAGATAFDVAAVRVAGTSIVYLSVATAGAGAGRREVLRISDIDGADPAIGIFTSQYPTVQFAVFPAGSHRIASVFSVPVVNHVATVTVKDADQQDYVVVVVSTATYDDGTRLRGFTWLDGDGRRHEDLPLPG